MQTMVVYHINARDRTVTRTQTTLLRDVIGSWVDIAHVWDNGDVCYVDDEGLLKQPQHFFWLAERIDQPLAGDGVVTGPDGVDEDGHDITLPPIQTLDEIAAQVIFASLTEVRVWALQQKTGG